MQTGLYIYPHFNYSSTPSFNGKVDKVISTVKGTTDFKRARITVNEAISVLKNFGYKVRAKAGSHMTVTAPDGFEFCLTLPHGSEKRFISPFDVKRLQCVINDDREGLLNAIRFQR